ncbi:MAG: tRNA lysidine(34) synthetase TilS [Nocardioidaceae bacterium]
MSSAAPHPGPHRLSPAVAAVRRSLRLGLADVEPGARVIVACSGGADSLALAACTLFESRAAGWSVGAVVVDHGLQPGSAVVASEVAESLRVMGAEPVEVATVEVGSGGGPEAAARTARYEALGAAAARQRAVVLLGHTRDDQAEAVLLGLARGSGTRSLAGMAAQVGAYRRPLLEISRDQTLETCAALGLRPWSDPHNADRSFARVRVRRDLLPMLERQLGGGLVDALARTAALARDDADALDELAGELYDAARCGPAALKVAALAAALPAVRRRVLRAAAVDAGSPSGQVFAVHVLAMERLVTDWHGQGAVDLPGHLRVRRDADRLHYLPAPTRPVQTS